MKKLLFSTLACILLSHSFGEQIVIPAESNPNVFLGQSYNSLTGKFLPIRCYTGPTKYVNSSRALFMDSSVGSIHDAINTLNNNFAIRTLGFLHFSGGILPLAGQMIEVLPHLKHYFQSSETMIWEFQTKALVFDLSQVGISLPRSQFCQDNQEDHTKVGTHYVTGISYGNSLNSNWSLRKEPGPKGPLSVQVWVNTDPKDYNEELQTALENRSMVVRYRTTSEPEEVKPENILPICVYKNIEKCISYRKYLTDRFQGDENNLSPVKYVLTPLLPSYQILSVELSQTRGLLQNRLGDQLEKLNLFRSTNTYLLESTHDDYLMEELNSYRQWLESEIIETREQIRYCYDHPYSYRTTSDEDLGCTESYEHWLLNRTTQSFPIISDPRPDLVQWSPAEAHNTDTSGVLIFKADKSVCSVKSETLNLNLNLPYNQEYSYALPPFLNSEELAIECTTLQGKTYETVQLKSNVSAYMNIVFGSFGEYNGLDIEIPLIDEFYAIKNDETAESQILISGTLPNTEAPVYPSFLFSIQKNRNSLENSVLKITNPFTSFADAEIQVKADHHSQEIIISCINGCTSIMKKDYRYAY